MKNEENKLILKDMKLHKILTITYTIYAVIIMLMPVVPEILNFGIYSIKATIIMIATAISIVILFIISFKEKRIKCTSINIILLIYLLLVLLATVFAKFGVLNAVLGTNGRGEGLLMLITYGMIFVIFSNSYKYIKSPLKLALSGAIVVAIYAIFEALLPMKYILPFNFMVNGDLAYVLARVEDVAITTMTNQNFLSSYICMFLPMLVFYYINGGKKTSIILVVMFFLTLLFASTLGGYITFVAAYFVMVIYSLIRNNKRKSVFIRTALLTFILLISFVGANAINDGKYFSEFFTIKQETNNLIDKSDNFGTGRMKVWRKSLMIVNNYKWFGVGPDSLRYEIEKDKYILSGENVNEEELYYDKAHSEPLQIAATTGIPSMIIYLIFVSIICIKLLKICLKSQDITQNDKMYNHMIIISILSYLMQSMINISVVEVAPIFWAILGLGTGIIYNNKYSKI